MVKIIFEINGDFFFKYSLLHHSPLKKGMAFSQGTDDIEKI
jgi:hypothetical protein